LVINEWLRLIKKSVTLNIEKKLRLRRIKRLRKKTKVAAFSLFLFLRCYVQKKLVQSFPKK